MEPTTVVVLVNPGDARNRHIVSPPEGVEFVVAEDDALGAAAARAEIVFAYWISRDRLEAALSRCPRVRWVHSLSVGVDGLVWPGLADRGIAVTNSRGVFSRALAEFSLAAMLHFAKDLPRMRRAQAARQWDRFEVDMLYGRTLGVIGYGDIGRAAARLARAFGMNVVALRRQAAPVPGDAAGAQLVASKWPLLERSDYVLLAAPLTRETRHMIAAAELRAMKKGAVLINVGRGPLVDEPSLVRALSEGVIRGAALDVFETEPLASEHAFYGMDQVLLSPHCADRTASWLDDAVALFLDNVARFREGQPLSNPVDVRLGY